MQKSHLYLFQIIGIIVLVCGYFLSDQPDSLSIMYFDLSTPKVISSAENNPGIDVFYQTTVSTQDHSSKKMLLKTHFSNEVVLPAIYEHIYTLCQPALVHTPKLKDPYNFLFFREINPPPPKC